MELEALFGLKGLCCRYFEGPKRTVISPSAPIISMWAYNADTAGPSKRR